MIVPTKKTLKRLRRKKKKEEKLKRGLQPKKKKIRKTVSQHEDNIFQADLLRNETEKKLERRKAALTRRNVEIEIKIIEKEEEVPASIQHKKYRRKKQKRNNKKRTPEQKHKDKLKRIDSRSMKNLKLIPNTTFWNK